MFINSYFRILATYIASILITSNASAQTQKGKSINLNTILESSWDVFYRMSGDGNTIVLQDIDITRTFIWKNNKWEEQTPIKNQRWDYFTISNNGLTLAGARKSDISVSGSPTKLFVYDFKDGRWQIRDGLDETLLDRIYFKTHHFVLSENGTRLFILNCNTDNHQERNLKILNYQNGIWNVELFETLENFKFQIGHCSSDGTTLLIWEFYGNKIRIYKFIDNKWKSIYTNFDIKYNDYFSRAISLTANGNEMSCIKITHDTNGIAENYIKKYKIMESSIKEIFSQKIDFKYDEYSRFSSDGNLFITGNDINFNLSDRVKIFKLANNMYSEIENNLINSDSTLTFGVGRYISDDIKTISIGVNPKEIGFWRSLINVYDISSLCSLVRDSSLSNNIKLFPNPTSDILQIDGINLPVQLTISNVNGQIIFQQDLEKNQLDLDKYPCGIYFISLKNDQIFKTFKIVKID